MLRHEGQSDTKFKVEGRLRREIMRSGDNCLSGKQCVPQDTKESKEILRAHMECDHRTKQYKSCTYN